MQVHDDSAIKLSIHPYENIVETLKQILNEESEGKFWVCNFVLDITYFVFTNECVWNTWKKKGIKINQIKCIMVPPVPENSGKPE